MTRQNKNVDPKHQTPPFPPLSPLIIVSHSHPTKNKKTPPAPNKPQRGYHPKQSITALAPLPTSPNSPSPIPTFHPPSFLPSIPPRRDRQKKKKNQPASQPASQPPKKKAKQCKKREGGKKWRRRRRRSENEKHANKS